jgi:crotonobetainyl-CoA:carnitine CoA-transferase CaiB-like acyl-CoA transferase
MAGPLAHLKVLDLSRVLAGPWAGQILGDLGADVIKIEHPARGDDTRGWGPPFLKDGEGRETADAAYFLSTNRNKRSLALDIADPRGAEIVRRLAAQSDVVLENFKVGGLKKYGLDYEAMRAVKPDLVYCSITGFGQEGPRAARAGYDFMIQGMAGLMSITGLPDGVPGGGPIKVGVALSDIMTGLYAVIGILAALAHRDRTGEGQQVDMALFDVTLASLANQATNYLVSGKPPQRLGNAHPNIVPYEAFRAKDDWMILAIGNDVQFKKFCEVAGAPELAQDPRFAANAARVHNRAALTPRVAELIAAQPLDWWLGTLDAAGVPCGPISTLDRAFADAQAVQRGLKVELPHAAGGTAPGAACPIRLSRTPPRYELAPPLLGQHTTEVLRERLSLSAEELAALRASGIV